MKNIPLVLCVLLGLISLGLADTKEKDTGFWRQMGDIELKKQVEKKRNLGMAKNVILFLGDGMSVPTVTAARSYLAELQGKKGGDGEYLSFEKFPYTGLSKTYCLDNKVADSACSATAFLRGVKANKGTIGVNGHVKVKDCQAALNCTNRVDGIASWAQRVGKSTGFVTTTSITDATPAGTYAYTSDRDWENDADVKKDGKDPNICEDVAKQLILRRPGKNFNVIMGGGERNFIPNTVVDQDMIKGRREDGINLIKTWIKDKADRNKSYAYVSNRTELLRLNNTPDYILGIFGSGNLEFNIEKNKRQPSLLEMTEIAIKVMSKNQNGYFLLVEGGIIDSAHHATKAQIALDETVEFSKAIEVAVNMTKEEDTLIIVTADHAHTLSISGYPDRYNSIFGFAGKGTDGLPYTTLNYANGMGFKIVSGKRHDMSKDDLTNPDYKFPSGVPLYSETHGGDDVAVYARGPHSHIFTGSYEESYIAAAVAYAAGLRK